MSGRVYSNSEKSSIIYFDGICRSAKTLGSLLRTHRKVAAVKALEIGQGLTFALVLSAPDKEFCHRDLKPQTVIGSASRSVLDNVFLLCGVWPNRSEPEIRSRPPHIGTRTTFGQRLQLAAISVLAPGPV